MDSGIDSNLQRISDPKLQEIYTWRLVQGLPKQVSDQAHRRVRMLLAATTTGDVDFIGGMLACPGTTSRGLQVLGKWHLVFAWTEGIGASEIRLE